MHSCLLLLGSVSTVCQSKGSKGYDSVLLILREHEEPSALPEWVIALADRLKWRVLLALVMDTVRLPLAPEDCGVAGLHHRFICDVRRTCAESCITEAERKLEKQGVHVHAARLVSGSPVDVIPQLADRESVALVVVISGESSGPILGLRNASQISRLVAKLESPVLLLPARGRRR